MTFHSLLIGYIVGLWKPTNNSAMSQPLPVVGGCLQEPCCMPAWRGHSIETTHTGGQGHCIYI